MKDLDRVIEHVFDGAPLPEGADAMEVRRLRAIRKALKEAPIHECRVSVEHLRNAVLDSASQHKRPARSAWAWPALLAGAAGAWALATRPAAEAPEIVASRAFAEPSLALPAPEPEDAASLVVPPPSAAAAKEAAPTPVRKPRRERRQRPERPVAPAALVALRQDPPAALREEAPPDVPAEPAAAPVEEVVIVGGPAQPAGTAIEVGLGQEVVFGG